MSSPISGFTAIPNPQMLAFMPIQSYLMMYFAGSGWQYGKRKISAMSNEEFNKLTPEQLLQQHSIELKNMLPTLERSLNDVTPLVRILIEQYGDFIKAALQAIPQAVQNAGIPILTGHAKEDYDKAAFDWLKNLFPSMPDAEAHKIVEEQIKSGGNLGFTTGGSQKIDFGGQSLAEFNKLKAEKAAQLVADLANRPKVIQQFGDTTINPQVSVTVTKRPAGQSAKLERKKLISAISNYAKLWQAATTNKERDSWKARLQSAQQQLTNLLARFTFE